MKRIGPLHSCSTPFCGLVLGYFCVKCRHYVTSCRCLSNEGGCTCGDDYRKWWAGPGERRILQQQLAAAQRQQKEQTSCTRT